MTDIWATSKFVLLQTMNNFVNMSIHTCASMSEGWNSRSGAAEVKGMLHLFIYFLSLSFQKARCIISETDTDHVNWTMVMPGQCLERSWLRRAAFLGGSESQASAFSSQPRHSPSILALQLTLTPVDSVFERQAASYGRISLGSKIERMSNNVPTMQFMSCMT